MDLIITSIVGLVAGFAFMGLGIGGILIGKTLGAASKTKGDDTEAKARVYGLIWLLAGFLILVTVVFKAHEATAGGIQLGAPAIFKDAP